MENLLFSGVPKLRHIAGIIIIKCLNIGTPKNHHSSLRTNGKVVVLGVPILKHIRVAIVHLFFHIFFFVLFFFFFFFSEILATVQTQI